MNFFSLIILINSQNQTAFEKDRSMNPVQDGNDKEIATPHSTKTYSPVPGPPPPPRSDSLNVKNDTPVSSSISCTVHNFQSHTSLDTSLNESVASGPDKTLSGSPHMPGSFPNPNLTHSCNTEEVSSPKASHVSDNNYSNSGEVLSPWDKDSAFMEDSCSVDIGGRKQPPPLIKQGSLYISPRKLSVTSYSHSEDINKRKKPGQILKAGGIHSVDLSGSRSNLLEAIRKGIQLRKVFLEQLHAFITMFPIVDYICKCNILRLGNHYI